jgi:hypothetical protein
MENKCKIYLDDIRTPLNDPIHDSLIEFGDWKVVRNYDQFVELVEKTGLENIGVISFDHDLDESAMREYYLNVSPNYELNYDNIKEKTGLDCAKWLIKFYYSKYSSEDSRDEKRKAGIVFPVVYVHSANPIGSANIMGYVNNMLMNEAQPQTCIRAKFPHTN